MRYFRMIWSHFRKKIYERINVKHGNFKNVNRTLEQLARALKNGSPNNTWGCKGLELCQDNIPVSNSTAKIPHCFQLLVATN